MIRILHIVPTLDLGGAEKQLALLANGLPRERFDVRVCALTRGGPRAAELERAGVPLRVIDKRWKLDPLAYMRLKQHIREVRPDIVHTWLFAANCYGRQAAIAAGVPHIVAGERCVDRWKVGYEFLLDRYYARRTARIITNSGGVREFCVAHGIAAEKFTIIPNGVESAPPITTSRGELLRELGLPEDARVIGAVGRLWPQKNYKDLIWSAQLLTVARDNIHLVILGDGPQRARLETYRSQLQLDGRVHFLGERSDVARLLPHFDCFWIGSRYEGQSNALMEAMAAGVPAVASDIPGNRELVVPDVTGFLVPLGDRALFARKTLRILDDRPLAQQLGNAARERMLREFSVEQMIRRHVALYEQLAGGGKGEA